MTVRFRSSFRSVRALPIDGVLFSFAVTLNINGAFIVLKAEGASRTTSVVTIVVTVGKFIVISSGMLTIVGALNLEVFLTKLLNS